MAYYFATKKNGLQWYNDIYIVTDGDITEALCTTGSEVDGWRSKV